jgi:hypothetical protein
MAKKKIDFILSAVNNTKKSFDVVTSGLGKMAGVAGSATKGVAAVGLAAVGTATALAVLVDKSFQTVDAIGKTSTQTGIATDTLQAFHLAARESGTTIEGANTALIKFARTIGDADKGLKTQADIFKDLGINLRDTSGDMRSFDDILADTAKGISSMGSQSERASALAGLFGRQGVILTGAIKDLSEKGLDKFIERAKDLGVVLSDKVIRRTEEFNDAIGVIKMQLGSFVNNITTSFLPVFEKMQTAIAGFITEAIDEAGGMDQLGMDIANGIIEALASAVETMGLFADSTINMASRSKVALAKLSNGYLALRVTILKTKNLLGDYDDELKTVTDAIYENNIAIVFGEQKTTKYGDAATLTAGKMRSYKMTLDDAADGTDAVVVATDELTTKLVNIGSPLQVFIASLGKDGLAKTIETTTVGAMRKFEDSIVETIKTGKLSFKGFADYVIEQMLRIAIQQMITKRITGSFESFFADFGSMFGSGEGGAFTGSGNRSGGMDGRGGFPMMVHPNETVVDHTKGQSLGGGSTTVNFNISTVDAAGFDDLLQSRKGLITQIINNSMNKQGKMGIL